MDRISVPESVPEPPRLVVQDRNRQAHFQRLYAIENSMRYALGALNLVRGALAVLHWWR